MPNRGYTLVPPLALLLFPIGKAAKCYHLSSVLNCSSSPHTQSFLNIAKLHYLTQYLYSVLFRLHTMNNTPIPIITLLEQKYLNRGKLDALLQKEFGSDYSVKVSSQWSGLV